MDENNVSDDKDEHFRSKHINRVEIFFSVSDKISQICLGCVLMFISIIEFVPILKYAEDFFIVDVIAPIFVWTILISVVLYWKEKLHNTWFGNFLNALVEALLFIILNGVIIREEEVFGIFPIIMTIGWILVGLLVIGFLFNIINMLFLMPVVRYIEFGREKIYFEEIRKHFTKNKNQNIAAIIISLILVTPAVLMTQDDVWNLKVTVQPQDYQAEFAFWASMNPDIYSSTVKDELNEHKVTLIPYDMYYDLNNPADKASFVSRMTIWNNSYPEIKFMFAIPPDYQAFPWDGQSEEVINRAKQYLQIIDEENLDNVIGLSFDWESPDEEETLLENGYDLNADPIRHEESRLMWQEFFDWRDEYYPDMLMQNVNYIGSSVDVFDGDNDIQTAKRYNIFDVPRWDEYAPMLYRGSCDGSIPYGDYPYWDPSDAPDPHYSFYCDMYLHAKAVDRVYGGTERLGVYIGITNCTCYGRDVIQVEHGEEIGMGYDSLVRDALIAKSFGAPMITIFILNTVPSSEDPEDAHSMGGVFEVWGDTFLDDFNESVNGVESKQSFEIWYTPQLGGDFFTSQVFDYILLDFLYDLDGTLGIIIFIVCFGVAVSFTFRTKLFLIINKRLKS